MFMMCVHKLYFQIPGNGVFCDSHLCNFYQLQSGLEFDLSPSEHYFCSSSCRRKYHSRLSVDVRSVEND
jgi:hypothetical protein